MALINYKLKLLLNSFSKEEIDQFRKFISSPYYSKGRNYLPFLDKVIEHTNNPSIEHNDNDFRIKNSGTTLSDQTLRNRYSELYKLGEEFLVNLWLKENMIERDNILLKKLFDKKLYTPFRIDYRETLVKVENEKFDLSKLKILSELKEIYALYLIEKNKEDVLYKEHFEYSILLFCNNLIQLYELGFEFIQEELDSIKFRPNYVTQYLKTLNIENIIKDFRESDNILYKITAMNYHLYKANADPESENDYFISHQIFSDHFELINEKYKIKIFTIMINYCIRKFNDGNLEYQNELFKLYKEKLSQNLIDDLKNKSYTFNHFRDFVFIGIAVREFEWVENFIEKYSGMLPPGIKEDEIKLSYAKLEFNKKNYERSLAYLEKLKASHYLQYIDKSLFKLFNYYELNEFEEAYLEIDKLKHYFRNNRSVPKAHYNLNMNFLKIYRNLLKIRTNPGKTDTGLIRKELENLKLVSAKKWLIAKINEINS